MSKRPSASAARSKESASEETPSPRFDALSRRLLDTDATHLFRRVSPRQASSFEPMQADKV
jgi:hypothetical protein